MFNMNQCYNGPYIWPIVAPIVAPIQIKHSNTMGGNILILAVSCREKSF